MFLKNRNVSSKSKRSKVADYAALTKCTHRYSDYEESLILYWITLVNHKKCLLEMLLNATSIYCGTFHFIQNLIEHSVGKHYRPWSLPVWSGSTLFAYFSQKVQGLSLSTSAVCCWHLCLVLMTSADNLCKQVGPRSGKKKRQAWSATKLFITVMIETLIKPYIFWRSLIWVYTVCQCPQKEY